MREKGGEREGVIRKIEKKDERTTRWKRNRSGGEGKREREREGEEEGVIDREIEEREFMFLG